MMRAMDSGGQFRQAPRTEGKPINLNSGLGMKPDNAATRANRASKGWHLPTRPAADHLACARISGNAFCR